MSAAFRKLTKLLYPAEWVVLLSILATVALYNLLGVLPRDPVGLYWAQLRVLPFGYPFGLFIAFIYILLQEGYRAKQAGRKSAEVEAWHRFRALYLNFGDFIRDLRLFNLVMLNFVVFGHLKHLIPVINDRSWDGLMLAVEKVLLFGGTSYGLLITALGTESAEWVSHGYEAYYVYFSLVLFILVLQRRDKYLSKEFCLSFCLLWILGVVMVYALPTLGPCFYIPDFETLLPVTKMTELQAHLWEMKLALDANPHDTSAIYSISGLPSLHLGVTVLGSVYLQRISRLLGVVSWLFVAVTFVSTLYLGWHWLLDDIASFFLVYIVLKISGRFYPVQGGIAE